MARPVLPALFVLVWSVLPAACGPEREGLQPSGAHPEEGVFIERAAELGLDFHHFNGMSGELYPVEVMGPGGALVDFDNDGDLDVYLVQGRMLGEGKGLEDAVLPADAALPLHDRLYRNHFKEDGEKGLRFTDVTPSSGILATGYGCGVATGDVDNDGFMDLYVLNLGPNQLWRNNGNGTFTDITEWSGTGGDAWSASASFLDYDADGDLDLFVANYIDLPLASYEPCESASGLPDYCGPLQFRPAADRLLRNRGDGSFEDVSWEAGIVFGYGAALGVVAADLDADGRVDLYVANDQSPNLLWINRGDGTFENAALAAGCALNEDGRAEASMGVEAADFDNDGDPDLFLTHLMGETNTFYRNQGEGLFADRSLTSGLGAPSVPFTSFGTSALDYDNDGWLDLLTVSGEVKIIEGLARLGDPLPLSQTNQLFHNRRDGTFEEVTAAAGAAFGLAEVSRGAASGDVDNDGDTDVLVINNSGPARLLLNQVGQARHWLGLRLVGGPGRRDQLGAEVRVTGPRGGPLHRRATSDGSFASAGDPRIRVGLGEETQVEAVEVLWPSGRREVWTDVAIDRYTTLVEGTGSPARGPAPGNPQAATSATTDTGW